MSGFSHQNGQASPQVASPTTSTPSNDFGSNQDNIDSMGGGAAQPSASALPSEPFTRTITSYEGETEIEGVVSKYRFTTFGGKRLGVTTGMLVKMGDVKGYVDRLYPTRHRVALFNTFKPEGTKVTMYPGHTYSWSQYKAEQARRQKKHADEESKRDFDREYSRSNRGGE